MKRVTIFLSLILIITACGGPKLDTVALRNEVMDIHDEVMPKMGELRSLKKQVLAKSEELKSSADAQTVGDLENLAGSLDEAYSGMMTWMNDWSKSEKNFLNKDNGLKTGVDPEDAAKFLSDEKERVSKVRDNINSAIKSAKEVLGS